MIVLCIISYIWVCGLMYGLMVDWDSMDEEGLKMMVLGLACSVWPITLFCLLGYYLGKHIRRAWRDE